MSSRSGMLDNLLPVFRPCLSVCVCVCMCEHSLHGQVSELSAQRGVSGVHVDQLSEPWKAGSSFIITSCWKITVREREQAAFSCLCTHRTHFYPAHNPLNPHLSIASEHFLLSHVMNVVGRITRQRAKLFVISESGIFFAAFSISSTCRNGEPPQV